MVQGDADVGDDKTRFVIRRYCKVLEDKEALDMDDFVPEATKILQFCPKVLEFCHQLYKSIIVDEFQASDRPFL